ncbi:hypothetical protein PAHAL_9G025900 [Panicum hallii]|jgi:hypothetical protein|uniref:Acetyltransferase n=1 Tax=Panicum hallii TaxID=206008 RepID=A0A2S3IGP4_9POAL|nr:uncharacterized acetyltransferase At3g50280-like [Panicum hallii]PAN44217.1 hypothetical protein PAHAL_9G025900 [Panicum hallii]
MPGSTDTGRVQVIGRRVIRAEQPPPPSSSPVPETIHLTPWDLRLITIDYIQKGVLLPKPKHEHWHAVVDRLASAFARALGRFHPFAGQLVVHERAGDGTITVSLRCTGEGAEFVHAAAPGVTAADITGELYIPRELVASLFPLNGLVSADAASVDGEPRRAPLLAVQVNELEDAVFVAASLNHAVGDGTTFWHFVNTWSDLSRSDGATCERPPPVLERWFLDTCPVPVPLKFAKLEDAIRRHENQQLPLQECFFHFSSESVKKLKARANAEVHSMTGAATISSLQAVLGHLWRSVCRARRLDPSQKTTYVLLIGCRGRVKGIPPAGYVGNAVVPCKVQSTAGEVVEKGLGWTAWQLNRAVASFDEAALVRESLERWVREPRLAYNTDLLGAADVGTGSSPRFDVYGNDFGWGRPAAVRCGPGNKLDGKTTVFEGRGGGGAVALEVCLAPDALARLVADDEFMRAVTAP